MTQELTVDTPVSKHEEDVPNQLVAAVEHYQTPLLRYTQQILRRRPDQAQDVVQETFLRLHDALVRKLPIRNLSSWLYRVAHNLAIDTHRREKWYTPAGDHALEQQPTPPTAGDLDANARTETQQLALSELHALPDNIQQIVLLKLIEDMTLKQISDVTGEKTSTVHYRLKHGLRELAQRLKEKGAI